MMHRRMVSGQRSWAQQTRAAVFAPPPPARRLAVAVAPTSSRSRTVRVQAVFEKFSERAIKSVMYSQQQAKELGASEVGFRPFRVARTQLADRCAAWRRALLRRPGPCHHDRHNHSQAACACSPCVVPATATHAARGAAQQPQCACALSLCRSPPRHANTAQVTTEHVLLGLIMEDTASKNGFLNSGLTADKARSAVQSLSRRRKPISTTDSIPFSREVRKTFEAATNVSFLWCGGCWRWWWRALQAHGTRGTPRLLCARIIEGPARRMFALVLQHTMSVCLRCRPKHTHTHTPQHTQECKRAGVSYISPEHILLALLQQHDASGRRVLERCAQRVSVLCAWRCCVRAVPPSAHL
jgi:hypothetical protein